MLRVGLTVVVVVAVAVVLRVAVAAASLFSLSFSFPCLILPDFSDAPPLMRWPSVFSIPSSVFECFSVKLLYRRSVFKEKLQKRSTVA